MNIATKIAIAVRTTPEPTDPKIGWLESVVPIIKHEMGPQPGDKVFIVWGEQSEHFLWGTKILYVGETQFGLTTGEWVEKSEVYLDTKEGRAAAQAEADRLNAAAKREEPPEGQAPPEEGWVNRDVARMPMDRWHSMLLSIGRKKLRVLTESTLSDGSVKGQLLLSPEGVKRLARFEGTSSDQS